MIIDPDELEKITSSSEFSQYLAEAEMQNPRFRDIPLEYKKSALAMILSGRTREVPDLTKMHFKRLVPPIEEFLTPAYIGDDALILFNQWKKDLCEIFAPDSIILRWGVTGSIGCVTGDTKIKLLDSKSYTIKELAEKGRDNQFWVFSWDIDKNQMAPGRASNCHCSRRDVDIYEVCLSPQGEVRVTWDHPFLLTDGSYKKAIDLTAGDSIQSLYLYTSTSKFFRSCLCYDNDKPVHRKVAEYIYGDIVDKHVHHKDFNRSNNVPSNLEPLTPTDHLTYHANEYWSRPGAREQRSEEVSERMFEWQSAHMHEARREWLDTGGREEMAERLREYNKSHPRRRDEITIELVTETAKQCNTSVIAPIAKKLNCSAQRIRNVILSKYSEPVEWIDENDLSMSNMQRAKFDNHTVLSVKHVGKDDVYDLTVDTFHNYGIDDGTGSLIFTHNCGKSTAGLIAQLYNLYRINSLRNPQLAMGSGPSKPMILQLFTVSLAKAQSTLIERVGILLSACKDYVKVQHVDDFAAFDNEEDEKYTPWVFTGEGFEFPNNVKIYAGSQDRHVLGEDVFGGLLDEAEYRLGCLSYMTKVCLASGKNEEIGKLAESRKDFYVYSWDHETSSPCIEKATAFFTKISEVLEVHLDNGEVIKCTPDHRFLLKSGNYVEAQFLKENDSLMALYKDISKQGYPTTVNPITGNSVLDHHLADQYNERNHICKYDFSKGKYARHHIDFDKTNNNPTNITKMGYDEHLQYHSSLKKGDPTCFGNVDRWKNNREEMLKVAALGGKVTSEWLNMDEDIIKKRNKSHSETLSRPEHRERLSKQGEILNKKLSEEPWRRNYENHPENMRNRNLDPEYQRKCQENRKQKYFQTPEGKEEFGRRVSEGRRKARKAKEASLETIELTEDPIIIDLNHKVLKVVVTGRVEPVYDISVERTHNFALAAGVFVHNSKGMVDKAFMLYDNIFERIRSRFLGVRYTLMCLLSSIAREKGVMSTHISQLRNDPTGKVSQYSIWDTKYPNALQHDGHFWVMRGTQRHPSRVLEVAESELANKDEFPLPPSCTLVKVPKRYEADFRRRTENSLMNLAGLASMGSEVPFDDLSKVEDPNLCPILYITAPLGNANQTIPAPLREQLPKDLFIATPEGYRFKRYPAATRYAHIDLAAVSAAGLAVVHKELSRTGKVFYVADLILKITSPNRINLEAVKEFIIDLRDYYGLGFKTFTADQYQSEQLLQKLTSIGYAETVEVLSVEKTRNPYDTLSNIVAQDCLKVGLMRDLKRELEGVYFENNKVFRQHIENSHGDMADALCGAVFGAVQSLYDTPSNVYESYGVIKRTLELLDDGFQKIA